MSMDPRLIGLDTSFVLRLLIGEPAKQTKFAVVQMDSIRAEGKQCAVSDIVVAEAFFALQYHYEVPKQRALDVIKEFLESPEVYPLGESLTIMQQASLGKSKPGFVDGMIHAEYLRKTSAMLSFEKAAGKLPGVSVPS